MGARASFGREDSHSRSRSSDERLPHFGDSGRNSKEGDKSFDLIMKGNIENKSSVSLLKLREDVDQIRDALRRSNSSDKEEQKFTKEDLEDEKPLEYPFKLVQSEIKGYEKNSYNNKEDYQDHQLQVNKVQL